MAMHPLLIVVAVIIVVSVIGLIINYARAGATMRGYESISRDVEMIRKKLVRAETFRDGDDLVVSGSAGKFPAIVRFSYSDNTPGLNIRMKAPSTFTLSVVPKGAKASEGRVLIKTSDEMFDARFNTRTDQPTQARMFLTGKQAMSQLQKLCCGSKTFLTFTSGAMELSELIIPEPYTGKHVSDHIDSMNVVAASLAAMPGADLVKITPYRVERSRVMQTAMAVLVITGILVVVSAVRDREQPDTAVAAAAATTPQPNGIPAKDAQAILGIEDWRLAQAEDFDSDALGWFRGQHTGDINGRLSGKFAGTDKPAESAYVLIARDPKMGNERRVVLLSNGKPLFDAGYKSLAVAGVVPHDNFAAIQWKAKQAQPLPPDGDALLIVRNGADPASAVILYSSGGQVASAIPANYQSVNVE